MIYAINEEFYPAIEKKLARIARKCACFGNSFTFDVKGAELRKQGNNVYKFILVDVGGVAKVNNWEFIATLDVCESGNIVKRYNTEIEIPTRFMNSENVCEHCHTKRNRNTLYVIHNTSTDEFKQVGGNCLALYTHGLDMEYIASWIDGITELEKNDGVFCSGGKRYFDVRDVLAYAYIATQKMGYIKANYDYGVSTKSIVSAMFRTDVFVNTLAKRVKVVNDDLKDNGYNVRFTSDDFCKDVSSEVDSIINYYKTCEDNNEFIHNVKIMLDGEYIPYDYFGYVCCLPNGYAKHMRAEIERAKRKELKRMHYGEIGKRYRGIDVVSVKRVAVYETMYGAMNVYNIVIAGDIVLTWKTNKFIEEEARKIDFTVKAHGEYKGYEQTEITRCKLS